MEKRGKFIVFEGIDGCGKTTQIRRFADYLFNRSKYNHVVLTREPYQNALIRRILTQDKDPLLRAEELARLFVEDRRVHAKELILPNLEKGHYVVSDRYKLSTIAYQSAQGMDMQRLIEMNQGFPVSDLTYLVDVPIEVVSGRMRREQERNEHKFEASREFLERTRQNYLKLQEILQGEKIEVVNGNQTPDLVSENVKRIFEETFHSTFGVTG